MFNWVTGWQIHNTTYPTLAATTAAATIKIKQQKQKLCKAQRKKVNNVIMPDILAACSTISEHVM